MPRPRVSRGDAERAFRPRLAASPKSSHSSLAKAAMARKSGSSACTGSRRRICARNRGPIYCWPSSNRGLCELGGEEIGRPFGGDRLERRCGAQVIVAMPERECLMQRALPRVHRERCASMQMGAGGPASSIGLAVKPERSRIELNDRRVGSAWRRPQWLRRPDRGAAYARQSRPPPRQQPGHRRSARGRGRLSCATLRLRRVALQSDARPDTASRGRARQGRRARASGGCRPRLTEAPRGS